MLIGAVSLCKTITKAATLFLATTDSEVAAVCYIQPLKLHKVMDSMVH